MLLFHNGTGGTDRFKLLTTLNAGGHPAVPLSSVLPVRPFTLHSAQDSSEKLQFDDLGFFQVGLSVALWRDSSRLDEDSSVCL